MKFLFLFASICLALAAIGQKPYKLYLDSLKSLNSIYQPSFLKVEECRQRKESIKIELIKSTGLITDHSYKLLIQERFSKIVLENEGIPNEISSASFKIGDDKVKLNLNAALADKEKNFILSFGVSSNIASNSSVIYSGGRFNTAFSMNARASKLLRSKLYYTCEKKLEREPIISRFLAYGISFLEIDSLKKKYAETYLDTLNKALVSVYKQAYTKAYADSTSKKIKALSDEIDVWSKYLREHLGPQKLLDKVLDSLYGVETKAEPWNAVSLFWFSGFGSLSPTKYNLYFQNKNNLVLDSVFNGYRIGVDFNFIMDYTENFHAIKWTNWFKATMRFLHIYTRFHSLRLDVNHTNNTFLYDTAQVASKGGSKVKAVNFVGDSTYRILNDISLTWKNIFYFGKSKNWGIELTPRYIWRNQNFLNNTLDFDAGLLFQLKDRDKEKAKVNFEFLFSFLDVHNKYLYQYPKRPDRFKVALVGGIPLSTIFKGLF